MTKTFEKNLLFTMPNVSYDLQNMWNMHNDFGGVYGMTIMSKIESILFTVDNLDFRHRQSHVFVQHFATALMSIIISAKRTDCSINKISLFSFISTKIFKPLLSRVLWLRLMSVLANKNLRDS